MEDQYVAPRSLREHPHDHADFLRCTYWLDQAPVREAELWEAVRALGRPDRAHSQIHPLLSAARKVSGMDSAFLVRDNVIAHCVNRGPLKLVKGQPLDWFAALSEELVASRSWQTHLLDRERIDAPSGLPLRVKTFFVLPVQPSGTAGAVTLCGISQMRVVLDGTQLDALNQLAIRLSSMVGSATGTIGDPAGRYITTSSGSGKARKAPRRAVFGHGSSGRDAVSQRIVGA